MYESRFMLTLNRDENQALTRLARSELRDPRDQVRFILRQELERCGLLPDTAVFANPQEEGARYDQN